MLFLNIVLHSAHQKWVQSTFNSAIAGSEMKNDKIQVK